MPARYHPLYDGLWNDPAFDAQANRPAADFEERAFFAYLCSNHRLRPSGIYRASDAQLSIDSWLPVERVRQHCAALHARHRIVRDGAWMFVRGYLARQPHHARLLTAAHADVSDCHSEAVLIAFGEKYPLFSQWSTDRLATVKERSRNGPLTYERIPLPEQSSTEQSRAKTTSRDGGYVDKSTLASPTDPPPAGLLPQSAQASNVDQPLPLADLVAAASARATLTAAQRVKALRAAEGKASPPDPPEDVHPAW